MNSLEIVHWLKRIVVIFLVDVVLSDFSEYSWGIFFDHDIALGDTVVFRDAYVFVILQELVSPTIDLDNVIEILLLVVVSLNWGLVCISFQEVTETQQDGVNGIETSG